MPSKKKWINPNTNHKKEAVIFQDKSSDLILEEMCNQWFHQNIKVGALEVLRKLLLFSGLSWEKYYNKIADLIMKANNEKQIDRGVNKIVKEIIEEMKSK